jgi:hypothetical protein
MQERRGVRTAALCRAAEILGGPSRLREILGVSAIALTVWMTGAEAPPTDVFLKAVDLIAERDLEALRTTKRKQA